MTIERFVTQFDGCTYCSAGLNCTAATEAMWLYRASQGRVATTACHVRSLTGDKIDGTNLEQAQGVSAHYGITAGQLWRPGTFDALVPLIRSGRYGAHLQVGYSVLANTPYDCFEGRFRGGHDVYLTSGGITTGRVGDPGADGRRSVPQGWQDIPWTLLRRAAGALPLGESGLTLDQDFGSGHVYAYLTPADPIPASSEWRVTISVPKGVPAVALYSKPFVKVVPTDTDSGRIRSTAYNCKRTKVNGYWWFQIEGSGTNAGRYFTPNAYTKAVPR